jgi:hypothetical protein
MQVQLQWLTFTSRRQKLRERNGRLSSQVMPDIAVNSRIVGKPEVGNSGPECCSCPIAGDIAAVGKADFKPLHVKLEDQ